MILRPPRYTLSDSLFPYPALFRAVIKHFFGVLLLATAWWMVNSVVPAWLAVLGWAALALWSAVMLHAFEPLAPKAGQAGIVRKAIGLDRKSTRLNSSH